MLQVPVSPTESKYNIGIEATNAFLRIVVLGEQKSVVQHKTVLLTANESLMSGLTAVITELKQQFGVHTIGLAVSGLVDRLTNRIVLSKQLPEAAGLDLAAELTGQTGVHVHLENDANAAAYGEFVMGAGRGSQSMFFATIGAGVGGALILEQKLWRGAHGFAGEFGHIAINEDGVKLEEVASGTNIVRRTKERLFHDSTSSLSHRQLEQATTINEIVAAAKNGDDFAQMMLERTGIYVGTAIASVINLLNVETVVLGGEVVEVENVILQSTARRARERSFLPSFESTKILAAELGANAAAIGAALLAEQEVS